MNFSGKDGGGVDVSKSKVNELQILITTCRDNESILKSKLTLAHNDTFHCREDNDKMNTLLTTATTKCLDSKNSLKSELISAQNDYIDCRKAIDNFVEMDLRVGRGFVVL